jgi:hypothetical protein
MKAKPMVVLFLLFCSFLNVKLLTEFSSANGSNTGVRVDITAEEPNLLRVKTSLATMHQKAGTLFKLGQ